MHTSAGGSPRRERDKENSMHRTLTVSRPPAWALPLLCCLVASCTVTPKRPVASVTLPETWSEQPEIATSAPSIELARWWNTFQDPRLQALIERGISQNRDIQEATARIQEGARLTAGRPGSPLAAPRFGYIVYAQSEQPHDHLTVVQFSRRRVHPHGQ